MRPSLTRKYLLLALCLGICSATHSPASAQAQPAVGATHQRRRQTPTIEEQVAKLTQELNLDSVQQAGVKAILEHGQIQLLQIHKDTSLSAFDRFYAIKSVHESADERIRGILNADQVKKFDKLHPPPLPKNDASQRPATVSPQ